MATTAFLLLTFRPFTASLLIMALLFNGRCCWAADVLALQDYACAKKDAKLPMGFNLARDDQLLMDPFGLSNGDTNTTIQPQIRVLLVNPKEYDKLSFAIVIFKRQNDGQLTTTATNDSSCKQFIIERLRLPQSVHCAFGEEELEKQGDHRQKECAQNDTICSTFIANCRVPMSHVEQLPAARHFTVKMWAKVGFDDVPCKWKVILDGVCVLLKVSTADPKMVETRWKIKTSIFYERLFLRISAIGLGVFALIIITVVAVLLFRRQKRISRIVVDPKAKDPVGAIRTKAGQFGVEVPESEYEDSLSEDDAESLLADEDSEEDSSTNNKETNSAHQLKKPDSKPEGFGPKMPPKSEEPPNTSSERDIYAVMR